MSDEQSVVANKAQTSLHNFFNKCIDTKSRVIKTLTKVNKILSHIRVLWQARHNLPEQLAQNLPICLAECYRTYLQAMYAHSEIVEFWLDAGIDFRFMDEDLVVIRGQLGDQFQWAQSVWVEENLQAVDVGDGVVGIDGYL